MKYLSILGACLLASGCTLGNFNSIHRSPNITKGGSQIVDAKQRFIVSYDKPDGRKNFISCAEPSPDVFSVYAASGEAAFDKGDIGASGSFSSAETGASLLERTTSLQALRDAYFRLCEGYGNGAIDEIDFMIGQRHNQTALMGLLAIEEMKAVTRAPAVVIGGSASATSASGMQRITQTISALTKDKLKLETENESDKETLKGVSGDITALEKAPADEKPEAKIEREKKLADKQNEKKKLEKQITARDAEIGAISKALAALETGLENAASTGTTAASAMPLIISEGGKCESGCESSREAVAKQMVEVVRLMNNNDYGPTICLSYLRRQELKAATVGAAADASTGASKLTGICETILAAYVKGLEGREGSILKMFRQLTPGVLETGNLDLMKTYLKTLESEVASANISD